MKKKVRNVAYCSLLKNNAVVRVMACLKTKVTSS